MGEARRTPKPAFVIAVAAAALASAVLFTAGNRSSTPATTIPPLAAAPGSTTSPPTDSAPVTGAASVTRLPPAQAPGWMAISGGPLPGRLGVRAASLGDSVLFWGGTPTTDSTDAASALFDGGPGGGWHDTGSSPITGNRDSILIASDEAFLAVSGGGAALLDRQTAWSDVGDGVSDLIVRPLAGAWTGSEFLVVGHDGTADDPGRLAAVAFDETGECCRPLSDPPLRLTDGDAFWTGDRLLLIGGHYDAQTRRPLPGGERPMLAAYDPSGDTWEVLASPELDGVQALTAAWSGDELFVWDPTRAAAWNPESGWRPLPAFPLQRGECLFADGAAVSRGVVFAWHCGQAAYFDPAADRWVRIAVPESEMLHPLAPCAVAGIDADEADVALWCTLTTHEADPVLWTVDLDRVETRGVGTPATPSVWELVPQASWSERADAALAWTGDELLVWGGFDGRTEVFTGWGYFPDTTIVHRIPAAPSPGRPGQASVWTGAELVIWRGSVTAWDPRAIEWRTIEATTPTVQLHPGTTAVWTGDEVLFWGATQLVGGSEGGAGLDVTSGAWRRLPASGLGARLDPVVAWSGSEMYVWGGRPFGDSGWSGAGAAYDPATDEWRPLPALPPDLELANPVGAWVGNELIVFGRTTAADGTSTAGAAYSPADNGWRRIAELPGPVPADPPLAMWSAVATGDTLAVWLPAPFFGATSGFGFYDPSTDTWDRVDGAPVDASGPTLAATGTGVAALTEAGLLIYDPNGGR